MASVRLVPDARLVQSDLILENLVCGSRCYRNVEFFDFGSVDAGSAGLGAIGSMSTGATPSSVSTSVGPQQLVYRWRYEGCVLFRLAWGWWEPSCIATAALRGSVVLAEITATFNRVDADSPRKKALIVSFSSVEKAALERSL